MKPSLHGLPRWAAALLFLLLSDVASGQVDAVSEVPQPPASTAPAGTAPAAEAEGARGDEVEESPAATCANFHETAQLLRMDGKLLEARDALLSCAKETCPSFVRSDCTRWLDEMEAEIPTVVFEAVGDDGLLTDVEVTLNGQVLTRALDGQPTEVPVGLLEFTFARPSGEKKSLRVLLRQGETNRIVSADFRSTAAPAAAEPEVAPAAKAPPPDMVETRPVPGIVWLFGATTLMATATMVTFGTIAQVKENDAAATCAPDCSDAVVSEINSVALAADVALGVALAAGITTAVLYLVRPTVLVPRSESALRRSSSRRPLAPSPVLSAGPTIAWFGLEGTFP